MDNVCKTDIKIQQINNIHLKYEFYFPDNDYSYIYIFHNLDNLKHVTIPLCANY